LTPHAFAAAARGPRPPFESPAPEAARRKAQAASSSSSDSLSVSRSECDPRLPPSFEPAPHCASHRGFQKRDSSTRCLAANLAAALFVEPTDAACLEAVGGMRDFALEQAPALRRGGALASGGGWKPAFSARSKKLMDACTCEMRSSNASPTSSPQSDLDTDLAEARPGGADARPREEGRKDVGRAGPLVGKDTRAPAPTLPPTRKPFPPCCAKKLPARMFV